MNQQLRHVAAVFCCLLTAFTLLFFPLFAPVSTAHAAAVLYVRPTPAGSGDCSSWANACGLQTALSQAVGGDEIWVAAGVHLPGSAANVAFNLPGNVSLYGGFGGTETLRSERNWEANLTILSGDVGHDDLNADGNFIAESAADIQGDNSTHVVSIDHAGGGTVLDGFIVTAGQADDTISGGGIFIQESSPILRNLTVIGNTGNVGGGVYIWHDPSSVTISDSRLVGNTARYGGGGLYIGWNSGVSLTNVVFLNNSAAVQGGGISAYAAGTGLTNVVFQGNHAGGGGAFESYESSDTLRNVTFYGNTATNFSCYESIRGGASMTNVIMWDNPADNGQSINCYNCGLSISYSDIQGGYAGTGNINLDPQFLDGAGGNLRLGLTSPAINAGNNAALPAEITTDLDGSPRFVDIAAVADTGSGTPPIVDMGAYESHLDTTAPEVTGITRLDASPTNAERVRFSVAFSEPVLGVDLADFSLTAAGLSSASLLSVSGGPSVYTVTAETGSGQGTLRLDLPATAAIADVLGNPLGGIPYEGGAVYAIDRIAPEVVSIVRADPNPTTAASVDYTVTFSEPVAGVEPDDFDITSFGNNTGPAVTALTGDGTVYTVTVSTGSGGGGLRLIIPTWAEITDLAGNLLTGLPYDGGETYALMLERLFLPAAMK